MSADPPARTGVTPPEAPRPAAVASRLRVALAGGTVLLIVAAIFAATRSGPPAGAPPGGDLVPRGGSPFFYSPTREAEFAARATAGSAHVLFTKSPGGALATAARVNALHGLIERAARAGGINPDWLEGVVFVESAGRPYVIAGSDPSAAAGLTQILASTGQSLLGMHIDLARSRQLLAALGRAGTPRATQRLLAALGRADDRFNPRLALAATVRYLRLAEGRFGRADLAVVSYHMGIGNLQNVLSRYDGGHPVPYAQLYFDTGPAHRSAAYRLLSSFGDQSSLYFWRVLGAVQIMRLYRSDRAALRRLAGLQTAADSAGQVLHPPDRSSSFADPDALSSAYRTGALVPLPANAGQLGLRYAAGMGAGARELGVPASLYRGLRPAAARLLGTLGAQVRFLSGSRAPLIVDATVEDLRLQARSGVSDPLAAGGYAFTLARRYPGRGQAEALQSLLDRLQALNLIAWSRGSAELQVTVASDAATVLAHGV